MAEMTSDSIVASCKANGGYASPALNDQLFLHCQGFIKIQNLEKYVNVKVLWLEQNAISEISGLESQDELVSLFLQNNTILNLSGLKTHPLRNLKVLNISHNYASSLNGLAEGCPGLETLQASHNYISSLEACEDLWKIASTLTSVDLSHNKIEQYESANVTETNTSNLDDEIQVVFDGAEKTNEEDRERTSEKVYTFFKNLPNVSVIYLQGNGILRQIRQYRRNMVLHLPALTYLDERPVFEEERRVIEAWGAGGEAAEAKERASIRDEKRQHLNSCVSILTEKMESNREVRDRLTKQWEERQQKEIDDLALKRQLHRDRLEKLISEEAQERTALEKDYQDGVWDMEEDYERGLSALGEPVPPAEPLLVEELLVGDRDAVANEAPSVAEVEKKDLFSALTLEEMTKTDDQILQEMEEEIQNVLQDIHPRHVDPNSSHAVGKEGIDDMETDNIFVFDRFTSKTERKMHEAIDTTSERLRKNSRRPSNAQKEVNDIWTKFEQWESPKKSVS